MSASPSPVAAALRAGVQREDNAPGTESALQAMIDAAMAEAHALDPAETNAAGDAGETDADAAFIADAEDRRLLKRVRRELAERGRTADNAALLRAGVRVIASLDRAVLGVVLDNLASAPVADKPAKSGKKDKKDRPRKKNKTKEKGHA